MNHDDLVNLLVATAGDRIHVYRAGPNELLHVGLATFDGDGCEVGVHIIETRLGLLVTDGGSVWERLSFDMFVRPVPTRNERKTAEKLARAFRVVWDNEQTRLVRRASERNVVDVVHRVAAASIALDAARVFWKPRWWHAQRGDHPDAKSVRQ